MEREDYTCKILIKINSADGIETIKYTSPTTRKEIELNARGKITVGIDYKAEDQTDHEFVIKEKGKPEKTEIVHFEVPRIKGDYSIKNGLYVNKPDLTGYIPEYTRYLSYENENLIPKNWITDEEPENWYDYKQSMWANIYLETGGPEVYYTWIPRYCFKLDQENQRSDVKFIDVYNNYTDEAGNVTKWKELQEQGYQVSEAFRFGLTELPGYWMMKYTLGDYSSQSTINYDMVASKNLMTIKNIKLNTSITEANPIVKYTIAIDGHITKEITEQEVLSSIETQTIEIPVTDNNEKTINVTGLNANGEIVGSMTKKYVPAVVNKPELDSFNKETTFYVTWDEQGNEHSTIPISQEPPTDWYEYSFGNWANIVTRNNGLETYYTWIPRYEFTLNQNNQRSDVRFLHDTDEAEEGYQVPEAFTFNGQKLTGYWIMKYTLGSETEAKFDTEITSTGSSIITKGIIGTEITRIKELPEEEKINLIFNYYINGQYIGHKTSAEEYYEYTELQSNTKYTIQIEIRNNDTNEYLGSIVKQIKVVDANKPELIGFNTNETDSEGNKLPVTYYVLYDNEGKETIGDKIELDRDGNATNMPNDWYNYSDSRWANIVVTDGTIENGEIKDATKTTYYTWIPRYEFKIDSTQYQQLEKARTDVKFLPDTSTEVDIGYQIPEAFTFDGQELTGYWMMKYTIGD